MIVRAKWEALREGHWYEYVVRFVLGGAATVVAGLIADVYGPTTGGLFLAFPAIFFASATLIEKHEREQKEDKGLQGRLRAKGAAGLEAAGAGWGSIGLAAFALVVWLAPEKAPIDSLAMASLAWLLVAVSLWWLRHKLRKS
ncbi:MAG: DUF3147 family protein [Bradyrhizobium sp.]